MAVTRQFTIRYANWNPMTVKVPGSKLADKTGLDIVRVAVGHAWMDKLQGEWKDGPDIKIELKKESDGVWCGERYHPQTGKKPDPFYVLEI